VIVAMLDKEGAANTPPSAPTPAPSTEVAVETTTTTEPATVDVEYFHEALAPYGTWSEDREYGRVFVPKEALAADWQPYVDNGTWVYTDAGWFWQSSYAWGWGPFHYGRWHHRDHWVWIPDVVWAPAWVSWRYSDRYYGWAPLPPRARFQAGVGFRFGGGDFDVAFGLGARDYFFVGAGNFFDGNLRHHGVRGEEHTRVYSQTTINNNYVVGNNNTVINNGIPAKTVAAATNREVKPLAIASSTKAGAAQVSGDKVEVFRPKASAKASVSASDKRATDKTANPQAPNTATTQTPNTAAAKTGDTNRAQAIQRIRDRAKTEHPNANASDRAKERANDPKTSVDRTRPDEHASDRAKERANDPAKARIEEAKRTHEERESKTRTPETRTPETRTPDTRTPETRTPETRTPETRTPETRTPETRKPEIRTPETRTPEPRVERTEPKVEPRREPKVEPKQEPRAEPRSEPRAEPRGERSERRN